jgi:hypothetical protein
VFFISTVQHGEVEINTKSRRTLVIYNDGKHKFFFKPEIVLLPGSDQLSHTLKFIPEDPSTLMEGDHIVVRKKHSLRLHVDLTALKSRTDELVAPFALRFASGPILLSSCRAFVLPSVFGVDPSELKCKEVQVGNKNNNNSSTNIMMIPQVLIQMKNYLYDQGGLEVEGIFRIAADENEMPMVRAALNRGSFESCNNIHCISTLIKVFFRELPKPLLGDIPTETLLNIVETADSCAAVNQMSSRSKDLLMWIVDLMCDVVAHGSTNKMSPKSCAIVMGPNLFVANTIGSNPMQALMISQKAVLLLQHLISKRINKYK